MLKTPSAISKITTLSDGTIRLTVDCQELTAGDKAELLGLHNKMGWFVFSETGIVESDIPTTEVEFASLKSLSERLRNVLYVLHEKLGYAPENFEPYRTKIMTKLINHYKEKINELEQIN